MERSNFIKLLEEYRSKAISELYKECKVQASLLISGEFKQFILELENTCLTTAKGLETVSREISSITSFNKLSIYGGSFYYNTPTTKIMENVLSHLSMKICKATSFQQRESEIRSKFDVAIKAAKASRSATKLKELADAIGIETPSIEVTTNITTEVDTEFVREKIKSVLLLK